MSNKPIGIFVHGAAESLSGTPQVAVPDFSQMNADMRINLLSNIEDYCILFGTDALPALRDYIAKATQEWTRWPDLALVEEPSL